MSTLTIWHNPRCSKSRETLKLLRDRGLEPEIRLYLQDAPDEAELRAALKALGIGAAGLLRAKEKRARELGLGKETDEAALIAAMADNPMLIERPVVFNGNRAAIGRPPESVLEIL